MLQPLLPFPKTPTRIISLVPSQTELLHHLGLSDEVVGITKFCVHPNEWFRTKTRVGGTKTVNIEAVKQLNPDLIIANKEENTKEQIERLQTFAPVWTSNIKTMEDALQMIEDVGGLVGRKENAQKLVIEIKDAFNELIPAKQMASAAYFIWNDPYMAAGGDTFINDMLKHCGLTNAFADQLRYPEISVDQLKALNCEVLLLSSEPYPFKQKHINELQHNLPNTKIMLVDGEMFSWYGSRLLYAAPYFNSLLKAIAS